MPDLITIIVPTRERADVLRFSLRTLAAQTSDKLRVIVSDNASVDETRDVYESIADERFRYVRTSERVSMSDNWEFALNHVSGGFVGFMGDDDGLMPGAIERLSRILDETGTDALRTTACSFAWPEVLDSKSGRLSIPLKRGIEKRSTNQFLDRVIFKNLHYTNLPIIYNGGIVRYDIMISIKNKFGRFFCSSIPDVFAGMAICKTVNSYIYSYRPEFINGASIHSNGTAQMKKNTDVSRKFISEKSIPFHSDLPLARDGSFVPSLNLFVIEPYIRVAGLSGSDRLELLKRVVTMVTRERSPHKSVLNDWIDDFCRMHNLDHHIHGIKDHIFNFRRLYEIIMNDISIYTCGEENDSIENILQASTRAGDLIESELRHEALQQSIVRIFNNALSRFNFSFKSA